MYRLVLFDLDGTLLTEKRDIAKANAEVIYALMKRGVYVGLATGRTLKSAEPYWSQLALNGPLILFNGARVWNPQSGSYVHEVNLPHAEAHSALKLLQELTRSSRVFSDFHVNLYFGDQIFISKKTPRSLESEIKDGVPHTVVGDLLPWLSERKINPIKIMLIGDPNELDIFRTRFIATGFKSMLVRSEWNYLEIMCEGISKGSALKAIESKMGIPCNQVIAFGDNLNDLDLIRDAGMGVAMGNAHPEVKALAKRTIGHHTTDAIASLLKEIFSI